MENTQKNKTFPLPFFANVMGTKAFKHKKRHESKMKKSVQFDLCVIFPMF